jgi:hydroxyethylthiazole kinase-like uncharacterized protein yjeF
MGRHRSVTRALLRRMPLPGLRSDDDKEARGRVLVVGGSTLVPGAIVLAGIAALRAGAGKLQLATVRSAAPNLGFAVPESLVLPLPQTRAGEIAGPRAAVSLRPYLDLADSVLVGPGMLAARRVQQLLQALASRLGGAATLVLDGAAVVGLRHDERLLTALNGRVVLTPHAGEMAALLGIDKHEVEKSAPAIARHAAGRFGATVVLKGAQSWIAEPAGSLFHFDGGSVGLGTSGSGDILAGIVAGLAASGAPACIAALWGVWAHGAAGRLLSKRMGKVGFLARELLAEVPALIARR